MKHRLDFNRWRQDRRQSKPEEKQEQLFGGREAQGMWKEHQLNCILEYSYVESES